MQLQHIHEKLTDKNEIAIIKKYDCIAKRYIAVLTSKTTFINFVYNYIFNIICKLVFK